MNPINKMLDSYPEGNEWVEFQKVDFAQLIRAVGSEEKEINSFNDWWQKNEELHKWRIIQIQQLALAQTNQAVASILDSAALARSVQETVKPILAIIRQEVDALKEEAIDKNDAPTTVDLSVTIQMVLDSHRNLVNENADLKNRLSELEARFKQSE